jgi:hypothetical protein
MINLEKHNTYCLTSIDLVKTIKAEYSKRGIKFGSVK